MGIGTSTLTQYDIEEVQSHVGGKFSQREISALYDRFCALDRNGKGYITADEFMAIPEFALNPLSQRLLRLIEGINFKDFVGMLSAFSSKASAEDKARLIFRVYDIDGNGSVSKENITDVLKELSGLFLTDAQREDIINRALSEAGYPAAGTILFPDFAKILGSAAKLQVDVPNS